MSTNHAFTGEHSTILMNLDAVEFATSQGYAASDVHVHFKSGKDIILKHGNAEMFMRAWKTYQQANSPAPT